MDTRKAVTFSEAMALPKIGVAIRVRPPENKPSRLQAAIKGQFGHYEFDSVHDETATQEEVFRDTVQPVVNTFLQGIDCTILAYGGSQTGKTHTLEGVGKGGGGREGVVPRAVETICKHLSIVPRHRYKVFVTYSGITTGYDASLVDLLAPGSSAVSLKEISAAGALERLLQHPVHTPDDVFEALRRGRVVKAMGATGKGGTRAGTPMHCMLSVHLVGHSSVGATISSKLSFVELVSPDQKDLSTNSEPGQARALAVSFSSLTSVLVALKQSAHLTPRFAENASFQHIPWRDAALTRWLKDPLSTSQVILIMACVAPGPEAASETLATLNYVSRFRTPGKGQGIVVSPTWDDPQQADSQAAAQEPHHWAGAVHTSQEFRPRSASPTRVLPLQYSPTQQPYLGTTNRSPSPKRPTNISPGSIPTSRPASPAFSGLASPSRQAWQGPSEPGVAAYGELLTIVKKSNGGLRAEALLEKLLQELGELRAASLADRGEARVLKATVETLQHEHAATEGEAQRSATLVQELQGQLDSLQLQLEGAAAERERLKTHCAQMQQDFDPVSMQRDAAVCSAEKAVRELQVAKDRFACVEAELQSQLSRQQVELEGTQARVAQLQHQLHEQRDVSDRIIKERELLQSQNSDILEKLQHQVRNLSEEAQHMNSKALEALRKADQETTSRRAVEAELEKVRVQACTDRNLKEKLDAATADVQDAKKALETVREERARLQDIQWHAEEKIEQLSVELEATVMSKEVATSNLHKKSAEVDRLNEELGTADVKAQQLRKQVLLLEEQLADVERKEAAAARFAEEERGRAFTSEHTVTELTAQLSEFVKELEDAMPLRLQHLLCPPERSRLSPWQPALSGAAAAVKKLAGSVEELEKARQHSVAEVQELQSQAAESHRATSTLRLQCEDLQQELLHQKRVTADRTVEVERLRSDLQQLSCQHQVAVEEGRSLDAEVQQLRAGQRSSAAEARLKADVVQLLEGEKAVLEAELRDLRNISQQQREDLQDARFQVHVRDQVLDQLHCELRTTIWLSASRGADGTASGQTSPLPSSPSLKLKSLRMPPDTRIPTAPGTAAGSGGSMQDWCRPEAQELLVQALVALKSEAARLQKEVVGLQQEKEVADELAARFQAEQQQLAALTDEVEELRQAKLDLTSLSDALGKKVASLTAELESTQAQLDSSQTAHQDAADKASTSGRELDVLQERASQQEQRLRDLSLESERRGNDSARAQAELKTSQLELSIAQDRIQAIERQLADCREELEVARQHGASSQEANDLATRRVQDLSNQLQAAEDLARATKAALQEGTEHWERRLQEIGSEEARLRSEVERLRADKLEATLGHERTGNQLDEARRQLQEAQALRDKLSSAEMAQAQQSTTINQLQDANAKATEEAHMLQQEVRHLSAELHRSVQDAAALAAERDTLRSQMEATRLDSMVAAARQRTRERLGGGLSRSGSMVRGGADLATEDSQESHTSSGGRWVGLVGRLGGGKRLAKSAGLLCVSVGGGSAAWLAMPERCVLWCVSWCSAAKGADRGVQRLLVAAGWA